MVPPSLFIGDWVEDRIGPQVAQHAAARVLAEIGESPGGRRVRPMRYRPDTWAVPVRCGDVRWLVQ
jgi:hypothetical protein